jgi:F0F1-type ATP synthase assembly protein I
LLGVAAGHYADREFETGPWLLLLGAFMGVAVAMLQLYRTELTRKR